MLPMIEKRARGGICHTILRHLKANNEHLRNLYKAKEILHIQYI